MIASRTRLSHIVLAAVAALLSCTLRVPAAGPDDEAHGPRVSLQVTLGIDEHMLRASAEIRPADLERDFFLFDLASDLKVLYAYVTEPGLRPDLTQQATHVPVPHHREMQRYKLRVPPSMRNPIVVVVYEGVLADDVEAGEIEGQAHNFSVQAHISERGVFLSESSCWYPAPVDADGTHPLCIYETNILPVPGWVFVASGNPAGSAAGDVSASNRWRTPRQTEGVALAGNQLQTFTGESGSGVQILAHLGEANARLAPMFIDAAKEYLALYEPLLGPYPYQRFSIVENFFSSGFAYPGFTLMDARVLAMGPRALMPGFLDHELLHNWWGNGVYISPRDGNWCEALTSHNANMSRYGLEGDEEASEEYRRGNLMKLAADPSLDPPYGCPLDKFSRDEACTRYVGYDKGAMVFHMMRRTLGEDAYWAGLKRFAAEFMGNRATWDDLAGSLDPEDEHGIDALIEQFVRRPGAPPLRIKRARSVDDGIELVLDAGAKDLRLDLPLRLHKHDGTQRDVVVDYPLAGPIETGGGRVTHVEVDPDFHIYRLLPPDQVIPTINNTQADPLHFLVGSGEQRPEVEQFIARYPEATHTAQPAADRNLFILGRAGAEAARDMLAGASNPFRFGDDWFEVEGTRYDDAAQAVMHSFRVPDGSGRYATLFLSNGEVGWEKLRLITHYRRDTTVVWGEGGAVIARHVHEPDRRVPVTWAGPPEKPSYD